MEKTKSRKIFGLFNGLDILIILVLPVEKTTAALRQKPKHTPMWWKADKF